MKRVPELDGIRGVAIGAILCVHVSEFLFGGYVNRPIIFAVCRLMFGGWLGVDIFFVLSGYLITTNILNDRHGPDFWRVFYLRRIFRIVPAFTAVFLVVVAYICLFDPTIHLSAAILLPAVLFTENWTVLNNTEMPMLPHLWSLAVEEQFYLVWPQLTVRFTHRTILIISLSAVAGTELLRFGLALMRVNPWLIYTLTPTRIDGLSIGAALAAAPALPRAQRLLARYWSRVALCAALLLVMAFTVLYGTVFPGNVRSQLLAIPPTIVLTAMLIYASVAGVLPKLLSNLLASTLMTHLGQRSYALYLIHYPILLSIWQNRLHGFLATLLPHNFICDVIILLDGIAVSLILTEISWYLIEAPAQRLRRRIEQRWAA